MAGNNDSSLHKAYVEINGVTLGNGAVPAPQELTMAIQDIDNDAGRNAQGNMVRHRVATKRKYSIKMPPCHTANIKTLLLAMEEKESFLCTFPDPLKSNGLYTARFYVGDRSLPIYNFNMDIWNGITFDLIEM